MKTSLAILFAGLLLMACATKPTAPTIDPDYVAALRNECDALAAENDTLRARLATIDRE